MTEYLTKTMCLPFRKSVLNISKMDVIVIC